MRTQDRRTIADTVGFGLALCAMGFYLMLAAAGIAPGPGEMQSPPAIAFAAGLAFFLAGSIGAVRAVSGAGRDGVPAEGPPWSDLVCRILVIAMAGALAAIGTWIAIGSGPHAIAVSGPMFESRTAGQTLGRTMFALGAVITWIYAIAIAVQTARKFLGRPGE